MTDRDPPPPWAAQMAAELVPATPAGRLAFVAEALDHPDGPIISEEQARALLDIPDQPRAHEGHSFTPVPAERRHSYGCASVRGALPCNCAAWMATATDAEHLYAEDRDCSNCDDGMGFSGTIRACPEHLAHGRVRASFARLSACFASLSLIGDAMGWHEALLGTWDHYYGPDERSPPTTYEASADALESLRKSCP